MSPATCLDELTAYANFEQILLVGHEPDFSSTISALLGCSGPGSVRVRKASVTSVSLAGLRGGAGELQFALPVRLM
jgi:phosphohistidine phosphatase SixA